MIKSGLAMLDVLTSWGADHIYGIPGGSINSLMSALYERKDKIKYIQVRHEEVGAIAASVDAKLTGKIGVCFGSAGPGATHLFNGLYDAQMDRAPVLAIIGQVASNAMNYDFFQELNENPMFADVSVYNRTVMTPESLPHVVDEAIRRALKYKGVVVVTVPVNFGYVDIPDGDYSTAKNHRSAVIMPDSKDIAEAVKLIKTAQKPVLYVGQGIAGAAAEAIELSKHYSLPIVSSVLAKGVIPDDTPSYMGTAGRLSAKSGNEVLLASDLILFIGSDFPFAKFLFPQSAKFIQVDINPVKLGHRRKAEVSILGDAKETMKLLKAGGAAMPAGKWFKANLQNRKNWLGWMESFSDSNEVPLRPESVFAEINRIAEDDAIFVTDIGNVTMFAVRMLRMNGKQKFTTSGLFATMGYGVPGGIGAKLSFPQKQVFTLNGDGAFAMVMQDIITQVKYGLPVINIVFSNNSLGYIDSEQEDTEKVKFGVDLAGVDFAKAAEAMGARGFSITKKEQLKAAFDEAKKSKVPVVIDVKITNDRPFPAEAMKLDLERFKKEEVEAFVKRYKVQNMPPLKELLK